MYQKNLKKFIFVTFIIIVVGIAGYLFLTKRQSPILQERTPQFGLPNGYIELDGTISIGKGGCYLGSKDVRLKTPGIIPEYVSVYLGDTLPNIDCSSESGSRSSEVKVKGIIYCSDNSCKPGEDCSTVQIVGPFCSIDNPQVKLVRAPVVIQSERTSTIPKFKTLYVLTGNDLYETKNPGPAEAGTSMAWSLANEFVYRTGLRNSYKLPSLSVGPTQQVGWYEAEFESQNGDKIIEIRVDIQNRTLELLE